MSDRSIYRYRYRKNIEYRKISKKSKNLSFDISVSISKKYRVSKNIVDIFRYFFPKGEVVPMTGEVVPMSGEVVPMKRKVVPMSGDVVPLMGEVVPLTGEVVPM